MYSIQNKPRNAINFRHLSSCGTLIKILDDVIAKEEYGSFHIQNNWFNDRHKPFSIIKPRKYRNVTFSGTRETFPHKLEHFKLSTQWLLFKFLHSIFKARFWGITAASVNCIIVHNSDIMNDLKMRFGEQIQRVKYDSLEFLFLWKRPSIKTIFS